MLKILKYLKPKEWLMAGVSALIIVGQVWLDLKLPDYMNEITFLVNTPGSQMSQVWQAGGWMMLCAFGSLVGAIIVGFLAARIGTTYSQRLRSEVFNKVESFSMGEINKFSTASLITRSTNDVGQVQMIITMGLQIIIKSPILAVWAIIKMFGKGLEWSAATGVAVLLMLILFAIVLIFVIPKFKKMQKLTDNLNKVTRENLKGIRVVRAYNAEGYEESKFEAANSELTNTNLYTNRMMSFMMPSIMMLMNGLFLSIYLIGASLLKNAAAFDRLEIYSNMVVFSSYAMQVVMAFMMMVMIFMILPRASVSAKRINEVLDTDPSIKSGSRKDGEEGIQGEVVFKNVSFKYPNATEYVLEDISFSVKKGETVAFIGSTGSGKSTLINLVPRFFDATAGEILIDNINVKEYELESLYNKIGYVPQKAVLFKGSVGFNVAYGENQSNTYTEEDLLKAIRISRSEDFVEKMEGKHDADVAQSGTNLSGGQKQRLAIARAIHRKPEIYIFDDSFSALDYKTDNVLRSALKKETAGITSLIVAQRIGTIIDADKIIVLDSGRIVGEGKHKELLKTCEVYREIAYSQLSEEELA